MASWLLLAAALPALAAAATLVVDADSGSDGSVACSAAAPCASLGRAAALAAAGDEIVVRASAAPVELLSLRLPDGVTLRGESADARPTLLVPTASLAGGAASCTELRSVAEEDFADADQSFSLLDLDGDGTDWIIEAELQRARSSSWETILYNGYAYYYGLVPDNWIIFRARLSPLEPEIAFNHFVTDGQYPFETLGVFVSDSAEFNINDFQMLWTYRHIDGAVHEQRVDLSAFADTEVWIGIRHYDSYFQDSVVVQNVRISGRFEVADDPFGGWCECASLRSTIDVLAAGGTEADGWTDAFVSPSGLGAGEARAIVSPAFQVGPDGATVSVAVTTVAASSPGDVVELLAGGSVVASGTVAAAPGAATTVAGTLAEGAYSALTIRHVSASAAGSEIQITQAALTGAILASEFPGNWCTSGYLEALGLYGMFHDAGSVVLEDLVIDGGGGRIPSIPSSVVALSGGSLNLRNVDFVHVRGSERGAAVAASGDAQLIVEGGMFEDAVAQEGGGAISVGDTVTATLTGVTMRNCTVVAGPGGAVLADLRAEVTMRDSRIESSTASNGNGGAIAILDEVVFDIEGSHFESVLGGQSGAVFAAGTSIVTLTDVTARNCSSNGVGGFLAVGGECILSLVGADVFDSSATQSGGAIAISGEATVDVENVLLSGGVSNLGGLLLVSGGAQFYMTDATLEFGEAANGGLASFTVDIDVPVVEHSVFRNGTASVSGGCIELSLYVSVAISSSEISYCTSGGSGGAIAMPRFSPVMALTDVVISHARAAGVGGCISSTHQESSEIHLDRVTLFDCHSGASGGAIYSVAHMLRLNIVQIENTFAAEDGGALALPPFGGTTSVPPQAQLSRVTVRHVSAGRHGGFLALSSDTPVQIFNSSFVDVSASGNGGWIQTHDDNVMLTVGNVTIDDSRAGISGGGLAMFDTASVTLDLITARSSSAAESGGVVFVQGSGTLSITDSSFVQCSSDGSDGGALALFGNTVVDLTDVTVSEAHALAGAGGAMALGGQCQLSMTGGGLLLCESRQGGALAVDTLSDATLRSVVIEENHAVWGGAVSTSGSGSLRAEGGRGTNNMASFGGGFAFSNAFSTLTLDGVSLDGNEALDGGSMYSDFFARVVLESSTVSDSAAAHRGGVMYATSFSEATLRDSDVRSASAGSQGGVLYGSGQAQVSITGTSMVQASAALGGGCVAAAESANVTMVQSTCAQGTAVSGLGGGVLVQEESIVRGTDVTLRSCQSQAGGGLASVGTAGDESWLAGASVVTGCRATEDGGGGVYFTDARPQGLSAQFFNNSAAYGADVGTPAVQVVADTAADLAEEASGQPLSTSIVVRLVDQLNNTVEGATRMVITVSIARGPSNAALIGATTAWFEDGEAVFGGLSVLSDPGTQVEIVFGADGIGSSSPVVVGIRPCVPGEIRVGQECLACGAGEYSVDPLATSCQPCPPNARCPGGNQVLTNLGYYGHQIEGTFEIEMLPCLYEMSCPAGLEVAECPEGHEGVLCGMCETGRAFNFGECVKCQSDGTSAGLLVATMAGIGFVLFLVVLKTLLGDYRRGSGVIQTGKILINYLTVSSLLGDFPINWPRYLEQLFAAKNNSSSVPVNFAFLDCLLDSDIFDRLVVYVMLLPMTLLMLGVMFALLEAVRVLRGHGLSRTEDKVTRRNWIRFTLSAVVVTFAIYPAVLRELWVMLRCSEVDGVEYLAAQTSVVCWEGRHTGYAALAGVFLVVYGLGIPLAATLMLYRRRERLDEASTLVRFGFLYQGYRPEYWGWEAVVMLRKVIAVAIVVYLNRDVQLQIEATLLLVVASLMIQVTYQPFVLNSHRLLETYSLVAIFLTLSLASMIYASGDAAYAILIFLLNAGIMSAFLFVGGKQLMHDGKRFAIKARDVLGRYGLTPRRGSTRVEKIYEDTPPEKPRQEDEIPAPP